MEIVLVGNINKPWDFFNSLIHKILFGHFGVVGFIAATIQAIFLAN